MANTINWINPATGAVSPTAAQAAIVNIAVVDVTFDGSGTSQTLTHNMNISAAQLALGFPIVTFEPESAAVFTTLLPFLHPVTGKTANTIVLTVVAVAGRIKVFINRPYSMIE